MDSFPGPLGQVLTNLVLNALTHGFAGREALRDDLGPPGEDRVGGAGGAPERRHRHGGGSARHVLEPSSRLPLGAGSGLGLRIARDVVMGLLGGRIEVSSEVAGTVFTVTIPRLAPQRPAS